MNKTVYILYGIVLFAIMNASLAETLYVTDKLYLGMHELPSSKGKQIKILESGTPLKVLERTNSYAKVRDPDGKVGWAKSAYLVDEIPPRLQVDRLQEKNKKLAREINGSRDKMASINSTIKEFETKLGKSSQLIAKKTMKADELSLENAKFRIEMDKYRNSVPVSLAAGAVGISIILGFIGGFYWIDYRSRRKHGGFRIY